MKKILFVIICCFCFINTSFANVSPASRDSQWSIVFDKDSELAKNISVLKERIILKVSDKNIAKKNPKYIWWEYFYDKYKNKKWLKQYIEDNTIKLQWSVSKTMFYNIEEYYEYIWNVNVTVEYTLKNESDKNITNQQVVFSSLKIDDINDQFVTEPIGEYWENILKKLYLFSSENNYPKNLKVTFWWKEINIEDDYILEDVTNNYLWSPELKFNSTLIKKVNTFDLSFRPFESKTLKITYSIPLKDYIGAKFMNYDFSPIFNWKNWKLPELELIVVGNDNYILNSSESSYWSAFTNPKNNIYIAKIKDIEKNDKNDILTINFRSLNDFLDDRFCWFGAINSDFFCWENWIGLSEDGNWKYKSIEKIDMQNVRINYIDWSTEDYKIFDLLK